MKNFAFLIATALVFLGCGDPPATGGGKDNNTKAKPAGNETAKPAGNETAEPAGNETAEPAGNETGKPESGSTDGGN